MRRITKPECPEEYEVMRLPRSFWGMTQEGLTRSTMGVVNKLIEDADGYCRRGYVMVIYGAPLTGKSGAAAVIAKKTMETGLRGLWTTPSTLRDAVRWDFDYSHDRSYLFHAKQVSLLVIDDLTETDLTERLYAQKDYRDLALRRAEDGRSTVITTQMEPEKWRWVYDACKKFIVCVECVGDRAYEEILATPDFLSTPEKEIMLDPVSEEDRLRWDEELNEALAKAKESDGGDL